MVRCESFCSPSCRWIQWIPCVIRAHRNIYYARIKLFALTHSCHHQICNEFRQFLSSFFPLFITFMRSIRNSWEWSILIVFFFLYWQMYTNLHSKIVQALNIFVLFFIWLCAFCCCCSTLLLRVQSTVCSCKRKIQFSHSFLRSERNRNRKKFQKDAVTASQLIPHYRIIIRTIIIGRRTVHGTHTYFPCTFSH